MDGNGRWAQDRSYPRVWGHVRGSRVVAPIVRKAHQLGVESLTLYAFSTENWARPKAEVQTLFKLLKKFLNRERNNLIKNNVQFKVIGRLIDLDKDIAQLIGEIESETSKNTGLKLSFAFNYGGRAEIVDAVNNFIQENPNKRISEKSLEKYLYRPDCGDVDLLIRTAGDQRISNFLLWQVSYAELYFTQTKWPEFSGAELEKIINQVSLRERRFGVIATEQSLQDGVKTGTQG